MREKEFDINNNILHFVYRDSDYLIDLDQLEMMSLFQNCVIFVECGKVIRVPSYCFDIMELTLKLLDNPNYMVCGKKHIINMQHIKSQYIESYKDGEGYSNQYTVELTFINGRKEGILVNSWREAERLYHDIDDKLIEIRSNQATCT
ncbi:MAG: hypothetical protein IJ415_02225 [Clostridia bacterium]|nr:hypothetical protein [Clostridia bacterium]